MPPGRSRFGYMQFGVGMAGLPGQDDIRPGTAFSITLPPGGVILSAVYLGALCAIAADDNVGVIIDADAFAIVPELLSLEQGVATGGGPYEINGVGMDMIFSWGDAEDLTYGGGVSTFSTALGIRLMGGIWEGALWHGLFGFEMLWLNFDNRPNAVNFGPYVGAGLEMMLAPDVSFTVDIRYAFMYGDAKEYDRWEFTGGFVFYW